MSKILKFNIFINNEKSHLTAYSLFFFFFATNEKKKIYLEKKLISCKTEKL